ncbi:MAG TPA: NADH:ubiquinone reductase (Na(+)-transporting) subunit C [Cytophagales bacterium]|nr:NADH:ubiquinone reductase (Na(+)-transporting) subunit C [Cytophagales bacterium]
MRQSNLYIIVYAAILTAVCGGLLAFASISLKDKQEANVALEQKSNILATVTEVPEGPKVEELYAKRIRGFVIDFKGDVVPNLDPAKMVAAVEYKKQPDQRLLPVYEFISDTDPNKVEAVVLPVFGFGLWNNIWGFVALDSDFNTVRGVKFAHTGETPGLGARIESAEIQDRYKGKKIFDPNDVLVSITMMKGEGTNYSGEHHKVDGMSGATLTAKGVNNMLQDYFSCYKTYLEKNRKNLAQVNL